MPEFVYTPLPDQEEVDDGLFLGHLDVTGNAGTATTRTSRKLDDGMGIVLFPALLDLLDGVGGLLRRGRGRFASSDIGLPLTFELKGQVMSIRRCMTVIDESPPQAVADAVWAATQKLADSHLARVATVTKYTGITADGEVEYSDHRVQLQAALSRFHDARKSFTG